MNHSSVTTAPRVQARRPRLWLRFAVVLAVLGLLGGGLLWFHQFKTDILKTVIANITSQVPTVATVTATTQTWQPRLSATGSVRASSGADLSAEVAGIVDEVHFQSGDRVAAGTLLLRLRPNDDDAKLAQMQAAADLASVNYERDLRQLKAQGVAQATVDSDAAALKSARAQLAAQQASAAMKFVRAPFAGRLGLRQVDVGQFLPAGTTVVTLQALDPVYVDFWLPQQALAKIRTGQPVVVHADTWPGRDFKGTVLAINARVDATSRMVQVRASLANADEALLPGMFATIEVDAGAPERLVTVPQSAIAYNPYGSVIYKVRQDGTRPDGSPKLVVQQQFVTTGLTRGDQVAVTKGVADGDVVVSAGQIKLQNNMPVLVNNVVQPSNDSAPRPADQ